MAAEEGAEAPPGEAVVRSGVRVGLKRELAFALKSQSEICTTGRTRSSKITRTDFFPAAAASPAMDVSSTVTSSSGGQSEASEEAREELSSARKMEMKMSKKVGLRKVPGNIRELLGTGLLEGMPVHYVSSRNKKLLQGTIKGRLIICHCSSCRGHQEISPYQFEVHAGSTNKHPSDFIYLDNGKSIRDVLRACSGAPIDSLESAIISAIGPDGNKMQHIDITDSVKKPSVAKSPPVNVERSIEKSARKHQSSTPGPSKPSRSTKSQVPPVTPEVSSKNPFAQKKSSHGKMTTKDLRLHRLVFMDGILPDGTEVAYYTRGQRLLEGYIKGSGIFCRCCNTVVSPSQFEAHAGWASRRKPYLNIYTSNGVSLHELSVSLSKGRKHSVSESDDLCRICSDGGDLLLCDLCPRAFHKECAGLSAIPEGDWYCPWCKNMHEREKYVEHNDNAIAAGRVAGVDSIEEIFQRCIRIVQSPEADAISCVLCKCHDFSKSGFGPRTVLICDQCEKEYHIGCLKDYGMANLKELPRGKWFCRTICENIHADLRNLLARGSMQLPSHLLDMIRGKRKEKGLGDDNDLDVCWRVVNGKMICLESKSLLSNVISIFHEAFGSIDDSSSGQDVIPTMVYGQELRDQDFSGMYCAVLTVNSSVQTAGLFRVLGCDVAELPLVATSKECQGHGLFQALFSSIEGILQSLNVKHLVLPAAEEAEAIWTKKFGFSKINIKQLEEYQKGARVMMFQGAPILHKLVPSQNLVEDTKIQGD